MNSPIFGGDAKSVNAQLDKMVAATRAKAERYRAIAEQTQALNVTDTSRDGLVTVTVDANGTVTDLKLTDRVRELSGQQVAAAVLDTIRRANAKIPGRIAELMQANAGDDTATVQAVVANYQARFPEPPPEPTGPGVTDEMRLGQSEDSGSAPSGWPQPPRSAPPAPQPAHRPRPRPAPDEDDDGGWADPTILR